MVKRKLTALEKVDADLPALQDKIRRDPESYRDDFQAQYRQYETFRDIVIQAPASAPTDSIISLRDQTFPTQLLDLLVKNHEHMESELREKLITSVVLLRKKELLDSPTLLRALFPILTSTPSKSLRALLYQKIISDLRTSNARSTNHPLNRGFQSDLFNLISIDPASRKAVWAVRITRELWRRQIWTDSKAVEIMKEAALAQNTKVVMGGVGFFLGGDKEREELADESSDSEGGIDIRQVRHQAGINKKSRKNQRDVKKAVSDIRKKERKKSKPHPLNFSALHLLNDPQTFAELLYSRHLQPSKSKLNLEQKLLVLQLVSRLVGLHKLIVISLYSYFLKYLTPKQPSVTSFLASLAQATHSLVPPDVLEPLIQKIANEFVSEASAGPVAAAGLNSIREICFRQPLAMSDTLLQDLVLYRKSKDKGVVMAAKGLLSLYRDVGPDMLRRRDRGKDAAMSIRTGERRQQRFGEEESGNIEGLELLEAYKEEERKKMRLEKGLPAEGNDDEDNALLDEQAEADGWNNWDAEEDDSDSSGGWIDVESDGEDINISDSDDEKPKSKEPAAKRAKKDDTITDAAVFAVAEKTAAEEASVISKLATTSILTPADLTKLRELRTSNAAAALLPSTRRTQREKQREEQIARHVEDAVTAEGLEAISRLGEKMTKEERIAAAHGEDRERHKGKEAKRKERKKEQGKSSTNAEKARNKNFLMQLGKARGKNKRSLHEVGRALKGHVERGKKGGRRGNR